MTSTDRNIVDSGESVAPAMRGLIEQFSRRRKTVISIMLAGILSSIGLAIWMPDVYKSEVLLSPSDRNSGGGLANLLGSYSGIANLAGISLSGDESDRTVYGMELVQSNGFLSKFIDHHALLVPLMASNGWDRENNQLKIDSEIYDSESQTWVRDVRSPRLPRPSLQEASREFRKLLTVRRDRNSGFVRISVKHYSPTVANEWVELLVQDLNAVVMRQDVEEAQKAIEYLNNQLTKTSLADLRTVFHRLIEEQTKTIMLAQMSDEYLFKVLDPAVVPEESDAPNRILIVALGAISGFLLTLVAVFWGVVFGSTRTSDA